MDSEGRRRGVGAAVSPAQQRNYVLLVLTALSAFNHLDRQLIAIVLEPVRVEFGLSDIQLGMLSGLAFAALYTTLSIPAALYATRLGRVRLVSAAAAFWGVMTMLTGMAQSFTQLLLARIGVGIGEAGYLPAAHSIVSSLYRVGERATALAILSAGVNIGVFLAFLVGGVVSQFYGWRSAFIVAGIGTLAAAAIFWRTVREPRADEPSPGHAATGARDALKTVTSRIMTDPVLRHLTLGATLTSIVSYGSLTWLPSFLLRTHGLSIAMAGIYLSLVIGVGGALGTWLGGYFSDRLSRRDNRWSLWLAPAALVVNMPLIIGFFLIDWTPLALALFVIPGATAAIFVGPSVAALHGRVPAELRAVASAIFLFLTSFVGLGLGPLLVGALSQYAFAGAGDGSLRLALALMQFASLLGALHYWIAGRNLGKSPATALAE